jgi:serine/threonine protein kinase
VRELAGFTVVSPEFFESLSAHKISPAYQDLLVSLLPADWSLQRHNIWLMVNPPVVATPAQGFKIHASATTSNAAKIIRAVVPACVSENAAFKVVADPALLTFVGSKNYGRGASSKFVTIYPPDLFAFKRLIEALHCATRDEVGPYILSDRRYRDSKVLFYRYGGFAPRDRLAVDGTKEPVIVAPDGTVEGDTRVGYFKLPSWVSDPFGNPQITDYEGSRVLNERYEIEKALLFSNAGGVYKAKDLTNDRDVIVKEARPLTATWVQGGSFLDAPRMLAAEYGVLTRLEDLGFVPRPVELFEEWEHTFLVEEYIEGVPLSSYRANEDFAVIPFSGEITQTHNFCSKFRTIALALLKAVLAVHQRNILLGDVSPNNVIVDPNSLSIRLIDFESACDLDAPDRAERFSGAWATPGFAAPGRVRTGKLTARDDYYALGVLLYSLVIPIPSLFDLSSSAQTDFIDKVTSTVALPPAVKATIFALLDGDIEHALRILESWTQESSSPHTTRRPTSSPSEGALERVAERIPEVTRRMADYIVASASYDREDRLWPCDSMVFLTNPLSFAYGACGPTLFLQRSRGSVPDRAAQWLITRSNDTAAFPAGLCVGAAGIASVFDEIGRRDRATELLDVTQNSPLLRRDPTMFLGAAGWGLTNLDFYARTGESRFLERANDAAGFLVETGKCDARGCQWTSSTDDRVHYGFGFGASGIALFLLYAYRATQETLFLEYATRGVDFELASAVEAKGRLRWGRYEGALIWEPYLAHGGAGIGSTLIRFYDILQEPEYLRVAEYVAASCYSKFAVEPGQFQGLAGIGEFMLDMYQVTGNELYRSHSLEIADTILAYGIPKTSGLAFPGRLLLRISTDYAFGSAGVGLYLHRLVNPGPRPMLDIAVPHLAAAVGVNARR